MHKINLCNVLNLMNSKTDSRRAVEDAQRLTVTVDPSLAGHISLAITRLGYLHPNLVFSAVEPGAVQVDGVFNGEVIRRDVLHTIYREKILQETLPLRRTLIDGLLGR